MITAEIQDKIDKYLLHKMSNDEKAAFEIELNSDADLKQKVEIQKLIVDEIQNRATFNKIVDATKKGEKRHIQFRRTMTIIWSAAAVFIGVFFINQAIVNSRMDSLYADNFAAPQVEISRGDETFRGNDADLVDAFFAATKLLETNQPEQAKTELLKLYTLDQSFEYYQAVRWYLALAELKLHNKAEAKKYLNELIDNEFYGEKVKVMLEKL